MKRFFTLSIFTILFGGYAMAYDFEAVCETGQTLYYNITSSHNTFPTLPDNVEVTYPLHYSNNDEYYSGHDKPTGELIIPSSVTYNGVTYSVTRIGENAFRYCYNLSSVVIPNSVTEIRSNAFHRCGLRSVTIPNSVTNIGESAFYYCGLTGELTIPNSVTNIGESAFNHCGVLTSITIGERVANIGRMAFLNSSDTIIINFNAIDCTCGSQVFGNIYTFITLNIGDRVENIPGGAFRECNFLESLTIPNSVKGIGGYAFEKCRGLTSVTIPNSVTSIGSYAFNHCNDLTEITIGNSVTNIGNNAFSDCWELTTVNFNVANCTTMGSVNMNSGYSNNSVFKNALALTTLNIGNNVTNIPDYAFYGCSKLAGRLDIPNSVTNIGQGAFCRCIGLAGRLDIPNSVISIGNYAFSGCSGFSSITIGERVNSIGNSAIYCIGVDTIYSNAINPPILGSFNCVMKAFLSLSLVVVFLHIIMIIAGVFLPTFSNHQIVQELKRTSLQVLKCIQILLATPCI